MLLQDVAWEPALVEPRREVELERGIRSEFGRVPDFVRYLAECPWLVRVLLEGALFNARLLHLDLALGELAFLVVSHDNSCRYCYAETRSVLRVLGVPPVKGIAEPIEIFAVEAFDPGAPRQGRG